MRDRNNQLDIFIFLTTTTVHNPKVTVKTNYKTDYQ